MSTRWIPLDDCVILTRYYSTTAEQTEHCLPIIRKHDLRPGDRIECGTLEEDEERMNTKKELLRKLAELDRLRLPLTNEQIESSAANAGGGAAENAGAVPRSDDNQQRVVGGHECH